MGPKSPPAQSKYLFRQELDELIDKQHPLVKLVGLIDWRVFEREWAGYFPATVGRPALPPRLIAGLLYLQHTFACSDEMLLDRWVENPYWQYFCGEIYFQHAVPCDPSSLTRWRQRIGEEGVEWLLTQTIVAAQAAKAVQPSSFDKVIVDTTVQEKAIAHPTDSRLLEGIRSRVVRDIERQMAQLPAAWHEEMAHRLAQARRLLAQQQNDKHKLYSLHAPEVECINKGKSRRPHEFGVKVTVAVTHQEGLVVGMRSLPGNPYDGHSLDEALEPVQILTDRRPKEGYVDLGYRGHAVPEDIKVYHPRLKRGITRRLRQAIRRRSAIEPIIGHMKNDGLLRRNWLKGELGDYLHAVLCGCGQNLRLILKKLRLRCALIGLAWQQHRPHPGA